MKVLKVTAYIILAAWILWFFFSWMNIGFNNCDPNNTLPDWNLFRLSFGW